MKLRVTSGRLIFGALLLITSPVSAQCVGDLFQDGRVDGVDLGVLLGYWGPTTDSPGTSPADLSGDGAVDGTDLGMLLAGWGVCPRVPSWATLIQASPDPSVVMDQGLRQAIIASGFAWRVRVTGTQLEMLLVPPGTFQMGCSPLPQSACNSNESPVHSVTLTQAFYLGRYEVKQAEWTALMGTNPSQFQEFPDSPNHPVDRVRWSDMQSFLASISCRLPTEAEWEYACRAGTTTAFNDGSDDGSTLGEIAWFSGNAQQRTHPVGLKAPNNLGFHDMHGNVAEYVSDWYGATYYASSPSIDPQGPDAGPQRILRGGSYSLSAWSARSSSRLATLPINNPGAIFGFRIARSP